MLLAKFIFALMKVVSHLSHTKPPLMCHLFNILVCPVAEYGSVMCWFMQAEEMERVHCEFYKFTGCPEKNSQPGMLWCYIGQNSFIDTMESFHGEARL